MTKEAFAEKYGDQPRRDDLTFIVPKQDDPTEQVLAHERCIMVVVLCTVLDTHSPWKCRYLYFSQRKQRLV